MLFRIELKGGLGRIVDSFQLCNRMCSWYVGHVQMLRHLSGFKLLQAVSSGMNGAQSRESDSPIQLNVQAGVVMQN